MKDYKNSDSDIADTFLEVINCWYDNAKEIEVEFRTLVENDFEKGLDEFFKYLNKARDLNPNRSYAEAMAGGPNHDWTGPIISALGDIYPKLDKEKRLLALQRVLGFFDRLNYMYVHNHMDFIDDPWLVMDITNKRPIYWCGYAAYKDAIDKMGSWDEFENKYIEKIDDIYRLNKDAVKSACFLTMAVCSPSNPKQEFKERYNLLFPELVDRTKDVLACRAYFRAKYESEKEGADFDEALDQGLMRYGEDWYDDLKNKIEEQNWLDFKN
jgi:hypothetical protein